MTIARIANLFAVGVAFLGVAVTASAQQPARDTRDTRDTSTLARLEQTLDPDTYRAVAQVIDGARERELPTDPLIDRALEGAMKRAPGDGRLPSEVKVG